MDKRELILQRLIEVAEGIPGIMNAYRNKDEVTDKQRPAIVILDADEAADDSDPGYRPLNAARRVNMTPEIYIMLSSKPQDLGNAINSLRAAFLKAILTDAALKTLVGSNGDIRYEGCATALARGRNMEGEMGLSISFSYILRADDL